MPAEMVRDRRWPPAACWCGGSAGRASIRTSRRTCGTASPSTRYPEPRRGAGRRASPPHACTRSSSGTRRTRRWPPSTCRIAAAHAGAAADVEHAAAGARAARRSAVPRGVPGAGGARADDARPPPTRSSRRSFRLATRRHPPRRGSWRRCARTTTRSCSGSPRIATLRAQLVKVGVTPVDTALDPVRLAALTNVDDGRHEHAGRVHAALTRGSLDDGMTRRRDFDHARRRASC